MVLVGFRDLRSRSAYRVFSLTAVWSRPSVSYKQRKAPHIQSLTLDSRVPGHSRIEILECSGIVRLVVQYCVVQSFDLCLSPLVELERHEFRKVNLYS